MSIHILNMFERNIYFSIPNYQRKYAWNTEECEQLYEDLKRIISQSQNGKHCHFFGSVVVQKTSETEYRIIDGQQRITTVALLLLAIAYLVRSNKATSTNNFF